MNGRFEAKAVELSSESDSAQEREERKEKILFRRRKTIISSSRGTKIRYLEKTEDNIPKPKQAYITINRGTKRILIDIK